MCLDYNCVLLCVFLYLIASMCFSNQCMKEICIYINISFILFSKGNHSLLLVWEIDGETYTQSRDFFLPHIFFLEPGGANTWTPLQAVSSETSVMHRIGFLSLAQFSILWLCLNLTAWLSRGLLRVTHLLDQISPTRCHLLFINPNVTVCQSTRDH